MLRGCTLKGYILNGSMIFAGHAYQVDLNIV
jgi:hypothetical protein